MPLLECSSCGSRDLQQVKPDTYFCNHCESVSKLPDPARVTVEPAFCVHGDPIAARCQFCGTGLCAGACDMMVRTLPSGGDALKEQVPTAGFGYLQKAEPPDGATAPATAGPFISRGRLLRSLAITHDQQLRHVCRACILAIVPRAADHIASGAMCENPWCAGDVYNAYALGACTCCGASFCDRCATLVQYAPPGHDGGYDTRVSIEFPITGKETIGVKIKVPLGRGRYCLQCTYEIEQRITETAGQIASRVCGTDLPQKPGTGRTPGDWAVFQVPFAKKATWRRQKAENDHARDVAKQYAAEISASITRSLAGCQKREQFDQRRSYRNRMHYRDRYLIIDERARVPATAVVGAL